MILKIKFINHLKALEFLLTTSVLLLGFCLFIRASSEEILFAFAFYSIFFLPSLYLHLEYYLKNRGQQIEILENEIILHDKNDHIIKYANKDLQKVVLYKSASLDKKGIPLTPLESYHYARIIPKQGKDILITCLMTPDVELAVKQIKWVPQERVRKLFSSTL